MFTRRTLVKGTTALATTGVLAGPALLEWAKAWAQTAPWKAERGAQLSLLRWKYFVQSEDDAFMALLDTFTKALSRVEVNPGFPRDLQPYMQQQAEILLADKKINAIPDWKTALRPDFMDRARAAS